MPLARKLAEVLGGSVSVRSLPSVGSTFEVTIPRIFRAAGQSEPPGQLPPTPEVGRSSPIGPRRPAC